MERALLKNKEGKSPTALANGNRQCYNKPDTVETSSETTEKSIHAVDFSVVSESSSR